MNNYLFFLWRLRVSIIIKEYQMEKHLGFKDIITGHTSWQVWLWNYQLTELSACEE